MLIERAFAKRVGLESPAVAPVGLAVGFFWTWAAFAPRFAIERRKAAAVTLCAALIRARWGASSLRISAEIASRIASKSGFVRFKVASLVPIGRSGEF